MKSSDKNDDELKPNEIPLKIQDGDQYFPKLENDTNNINGKFVKGLLKKSSKYDVDGDANTLTSYEENLNAIINKKNLKAKSIRLNNIVKNILTSDNVALKNNDSNTNQNESYGYQHNYGNYKSHNLSKSNAYSSNNYGKNHWNSNVNDSISEKHSSKISDMLQKISRSLSSKLSTSHKHKGQKIDEEVKNEESGSEDEEDEHVYLDENDEEILLQMTQGNPGLTTQIIKETIKTVEEIYQEMSSTESITDENESRRNSRIKSLVEEKLTDILDNAIKLSNEPVRTSLHSQGKMKTSGSVDIPKESVTTPSKSYRRTSKLHSAPQQDFSLVLPNASRCNNIPQMDNNFDSNCMHCCCEEDYYDCCRSPPCGCSSPVNINICQEPWSRIEISTPENIDNPGFSLNVTPCSSPDPCSVKSKSLYCDNIPKIDSCTNQKIPTAKSNYNYDIKIPYAKQATYSFDKPKIIYPQSNYPCENEEEDDTEELLRICRKYLQKRNSMNSVRCNSKFRPSINCDNSSIPKMGNGCSSPSSSYSIPKSQSFHYHPCNTKIPMFPLDRKARPQHQYMGNIPNYTNSTDIPNCYNFMDNLNRNIPVIPGNFDMECIGKYSACCSQNNKVPMTDGPYYRDSVTSLTSSSCNKNQYPLNTRRSTPIIRVGNNETRRSKPSRNLHHPKSEKYKTANTEEDGFDLGDKFRNICRSCNKRKNKSRSMEPLGKNEKDKYRHYEKMKLISDLNKYSTCKCPDNPIKRASSQLNLKSPHKISGLLQSYSKHSNQLKSSVGNLSKTTFKDSQPKSNSTRRSISQIIDENTLDDKSEKQLDIDVKSESPGKSSIRGFEEYEKPMNSDPDEKVEYFINSIIKQQQKKFLDPIPLMKVISSSYDTPSIKTSNFNGGSSIEYLDKNLATDHSSNLTFTSPIMKSVSSSSKDITYVQVASIGGDRIYTVNNGDMYDKNSESGRKLLDVLSKLYNPTLAIDSDSIREESSKVSDRFNHLKQTDMSNKANRINGGIEQPLSINQYHDHHIKHFQSDGSTTLESVTNKLTESNRAMNIDNRANNKLNESNRANNKLNESFRANNKLNESYRANNKLNESNRATNIDIEPIVNHESLDFSDEEKGIRGHKRITTMTKDAPHEHFSKSVKEVTYEKDSQTFPNDLFSNQDIDLKQPDNRVSRVTKSTKRSSRRPKQVKKTTTVERKVVTNNTISNTKSFDKKQLTMNLEIPIIVNSPDCDENSNKKPKCRPLQVNFCSDCSCDEFNDDCEDYNDDDDDDYDDSDDCTKLICGIGNNDVINDLDYYYSNGTNYNICHGTNCCSNHSIHTCFQ